jgi:NADH-quinone oxidoreductase subunit J
MFDIIFYIFAVVTLAGAFVTATAKSLIYAAFGLLFTFFGVAGLYVMANADFLAITQLMVYVGGILVLLIFGIMLTNRVSTANISIGGGSKLVTGLLSLGIFAILMMAFFGKSSVHTVKNADGKDTTISSWITHEHEPWSQSPWRGNIFDTVLNVKYGAPSEKPGEGSQGTSAAIGVLMLTDFLLPFEAVSVVILAALIGAAMIARKEPTPEEEQIAESHGGVQ